ncbi:MAG TPA: S41 family peptidase [Phnomibacter sp.]|nr:S41 family peptidase [Phnomibacter sp.]
MRRRVTGWMSKWSGYCLMLFTALSCSVAKYQPNKKYSPQQLQQETDILWQTYQQVHPSYNWYKPADSIDARFRQVKQSITDSLTESEFRLRLSWAAAAIRCGHTAVRPPKAASSAVGNNNKPAFPLQVRVLQNDTLVVLQNTGPLRDSVNRGVVLQAIDSVPVSVLLAQMREYISVDGYHNGFSNSLISTGFATRFVWLYGLQAFYKVQYLDSAGKSLQASIRPQPPRPKDSLRTAPRPPKPPTTAKPAYGFLEIDSAGRFAYLRLNSFTGNKVNGFIRQSFRQLEASGIRQLILDLRGNNGGRIKKSVLLAKYLSDHPFKVADSVSAVGFQFPYSRYVQSGWVYRWFGWLIASKGNDGRLHLKSMERKVYKPKTKHHFDGKLYVLTGGRTFSAAVLFLNYLNHQNNLVLAGEETGGGARGNSSVLMPDIVLPYTKIRARLPLFRMVSHASLPHNGRGVIPDVIIHPTSADVVAGRDAVIQKAEMLISEN